MKEESRKVAGRRSGEVVSDAPRHDGRRRRDRRSGEAPAEESHKEKPAVPAKVGGGSREEEDGITGSAGVFGTQVQHLIAIGRLSTL